MQANLDVRLLALTCRRESNCDEFGKAPGSSGALGDPQWSQTSGRGGVGRLADEQTLLGE
jgi:hypothetical protein